MTSLSRRGLVAASLAGGSVGRALANPGQATVAAPVRVSLNENPFGPSPATRRALAAQLERVDRYGDESQSDALLTRIAAQEGVAREQIVVGEILETLGLFLAARPPAGGRFIYSLPGYTALIDAARPLGGVGVGVPLDAGLANDLPALSRAMTSDTRALYLVNPHNPSGTMNDRVAFDAFLREAAQRALVIVDEAYLEYDDMARSAVRFTRAGLDVAVFRTLDKIHGLAGLPIGYILAPLPLARALRAAGFGDPHGLGRLALAVANAALADTAWVSQVRRRTLAGRARLTEALDALHLQHSQSLANFVFFRSPVAADTLRHALAQRGILVARAFPPLTEWIRISVGTEAEVGRTIAALRSSLEALRTDAR